jgi:peptidylprolyl isomerase
LRLALLLLLVCAVGCSKTEGTGSSVDPTEVPEPPGPPDLQITDVSAGTGAEAKDGDTVSCNYRGTLRSGKEFDSSTKQNKPFTFTLGAGKAIKGWDKGVVGMKVGGKRKLVVPPQLAYGDRGVPGIIPPNATLLFDIELVDVKAKDGGS